MGNEVSYPQGAGAQEKRTPRSGRPEVGQTGVFCGGVQPINLCGTGLDLACCAGEGSARPEDDQGEGAALVPAPARDQRLIHSTYFSRRDGGSESPDLQRQKSGSGFKSGTPGGGTYISSLNHSPARTKSPVPKLEFYLKKKGINK